MRARAAGFHAKFIPYASPRVRAKITAAAVAGRRYLAGCPRKCDIYRFLAADLGHRFRTLTERQLRVLAVLSFAEAVDSRLAGADDMSELSELALQDAEQKMDQTMSTLTDIIKAENDTAMSVIKNIKD